jgi:endonuclease/exonuclease/phosphatase family metal-dependent hydrolase
VKVLFLNTRKKRIDCRTLLRIGRRPDVIVLAELLQGSQRHFEDGLTELDYVHMSRPTLHSRKRHVRLYSRLPLESNDRFIKNGNKLKNNWLWCQIGDVLVSGIHMPTKGMKKRPFEHLQKWMKKQAQSRTLLIGDFNTDHHDEKWGPQLKSWIEFGWRNLWDQTRGGDKAWTFKGARKSDRPRRIDHAFISRGVKKAKLKHLSAFRMSRLSDHSGLLVSI